MGVVWLRAIAPSGPPKRSTAPKLSVVVSFISIAMLQSTFLDAQKLLKENQFLYYDATQAYHGSRRLVKRARLRLLADV